MKSWLMSVACTVFLFTGTAEGKTLVFCSEGSPESLNPQFATTTTGMNAGRPIFNTLVEFAPGTTRIVPALAESWTISSDGKEYTFRLRPGVKFHSNASFKPGRDFDADDVLFSVFRQWKPDHPYHAVSGGRYDYFKDMEMPDLLQAVEKLNDRTVRFRLKRPEAPFLANLAMPFNVILSAEYAEALTRTGTPERIDTNPIGTGPFMFAGFQKDIAIRYRAFADYWGGRPPIDVLVFSITPNSAVRLIKLKAGECHVMAFPSPNDAPQIAADPALKLLRQEGLNVGYLAMNTKIAPFNDVRVRRAVNLAIDKAAVVKAIYRDGGVVAKNPIPPSLWSYNDAVVDYPYDPAEAQRLMTVAGFPNGFETELWYLPVSRPYNPNGKRMAELIQADLAKVGIRVRLMTKPWSQYRADLQAGIPPMALFGWTGDNGDPDNFLHILLGCAAARVGGNNLSKWCDRTYDDLVLRAKRTADQPARQALYEQAQAVFKEQAPWVPIAHSVVFMATRKEVDGFRMDPLDRHTFSGVDLKN
jgi:dipeptide transport system substrate-binding protein